MEYLFLINFSCALLIGLFGQNRKLGFWGYFFATLVLTPLIGLLLVLASDSKKTKEIDGV